MSTRKMQENLLCWFSNLHKESVKTRQSSSWLTSNGSLHPFVDWPSDSSILFSETSTAQNRRRKTTPFNRPHSPIQIDLLAEHPTVVNFRWDHAQSWGSTWSFLITSISTYIIAATFLHLVLPRSRRIPLGPIPAIHSLAITLISVLTFVGILLSTAAEIRDTRWFWRRTNTTAFKWLLCFPLGTRPSGRVFFWSYVFYLSRFLHLLRTFFSVLKRRKLTSFQLFNQSMLICMSFLWLEFSQSFQVLAIILTTLLYSVVYGYRFWTAIGLPSARFPFVVNCQLVILGCNLIGHFGVLFLHKLKGGCNGIGAWTFNSMLNSVILLLFINFYFKMYLRNKKISEGSSRCTEN